MNAHLHGMPHDQHRRRARDGHEAAPEDRKLDDIIEKVEKEIFKCQEMTNYKT